MIASRQVTIRHKIKFYMQHSGHQLGLACNQQHSDANNNLVRRKDETVTMETGCGFYNRFVDNECVASQRSNPDLPANRAKHQ
jgi:hypothetical protein